MHVKMLRDTGIACQTVDTGTGPGVLSLLVGAPAPLIIRLRRLECMPGVRADTRVTA
jgi:hypothetical protein